MLARGILMAPATPKASSGHDATRVADREARTRTPSLGTGSLPRRIEGIARSDQETAFEASEGKVWCEKDPRTRRSAPRQATRSKATRVDTGVAESFR